jgi:hypothetical protein
MTAPTRTQQALARAILALASQDQLDDVSALLLLAFELESPGENFLSELVKQAKMLNTSFEAPPRLHLNGTCKYAHRRT